MENDIEPVNGWQEKIVPFFPYVLKFFLFAVPFTAVAAVFSDEKRMLFVTKKAMVIRCTL